MFTFYNTLNRQVEEFHSKEEGKVSMYTCGPTVYHFAHIGNIRTYIMQDALIPMVTDDQIHKTFEVNVFAMMHFIQYVSKVMKRQHSGTIINAASIMGISGNYAQMVYAASKGAVIALTKSAAKELAQDGIRVNAVAPGTINTKLLENTPEETLAQIKSRIYMGELGTPEEVANAYLFLASDLSSYISGQVLGVDGMMIN